MPVLIFLLLTSFVSNAEDFDSVQGKLRVFFPTKMTVETVDVKLVEKHSLQNVQTISRQSCPPVSGNLCTILLQYSIKNIDQEKQYSVNVSVIPQTTKISQVYQSTFPVLTFQNPKKLNLVVNIPPSPIE